MKAMLRYIHPVLFACWRLAPNPKETESFALSLLSRYTSAIPVWLIENNMQMNVLLVFDDYKAAKANTDHLPGLTDAQNHKKMEP